MTGPPAGGALAPFTVLDLTRYRAGPTAARQLADWGADVIKIEMPSAPTTEADPIKGRHGPDFQNLHRNKRSLTLNLKAPEGRAVFRRLAGRADVVIENYRPDVKYRLGIEPETLRALNPRLVYASLSGFGQDGPYAQRPGFDQIAQGMGGLMSITGAPGGGPMRAGIPIADLSAGLYTAIGILVALLERERSGQGQWVRSSLLEAMIAQLDFQAARYLFEGEAPGQAGNDHPTSIPTGVFETADGHINIATSGGAIYERLCRAIGAPALIRDPRFATGDARSANRAALNARIAARTRTRTSAEWVRTLNEAGVPAGRSTPSMRCSTIRRCAISAWPPPSTTPSWAPRASSPRRCASTARRSPSARPRRNSAPIPTKSCRHWATAQRRSIPCGSGASYSPGESAMTDQLLVETAGAVGRIVFNNPRKHNALTVAMWRALPAALDRLEADPAVRAIVLEGAGERAFVSGADISEFAARRASAADVAAYDRLAEGATERLRMAGKPTLAMIRGYCMGGGLGLAIACDMRIAGAGACFAIPAARLGVGYRIGSLKLLVDLVGPGLRRGNPPHRAPVHGGRGGAHRPRQPHRPRCRARRYGRGILCGLAGNAPLSMRASKRMIAELARSGAAGVDSALCDALVTACFESADYTEGRTAFMEKRPPRFTGR